MKAAQRQAISSGESQATAGLAEEEPLFATGPKSQNQAGCYTLESGFHRQSCCLAESLRFKH